MYIYICMCTYKHTFPVASPRIDSSVATALFFTTINMIIYISHPFWHTYTHAYTIYIYICISILHDTEQHMYNTNEM